MAGSDHAILDLGDDNLQFTTNDYNKVCQLFICFSSSWSLSWSRCNLDLWAVNLETILFSYKFNSMWQQR